MQRQSGPPQVIADYNAAEYPRVAGWLRKAADAGNADAMTKLGFWYLKGIGVEKNEREGVQWTLRGVEGGSGQVSIAKTTGMRERRIRESIALLAAGKNGLKWTNARKGSRQVFEMNRWNRCSSVEGCVEVRRRRGDRRLCLVGTLDLVLGARPTDRDGRVAACGRPRVAS